MSCRRHRLARNSRSHATWAYQPIPVSTHSRTVQVPVSLDFGVTGEADGPKEIATGSVDGSKEMEDGRNLDLQLLANLLGMRSMHPRVYGSSVVQAIILFR